MWRLTIVEQTLLTTVIAITRPAATESAAAEARAIADVLRAGRISRVHLRKPEATAAQMEEIVRLIPEELYSRISLHSHFGLAVKYRLGGVHVNSRCSSVPDGFRGLVSRSCHSVDEVLRNARQYDYVFLSPVFDSISKQGYSGSFNNDDIRRQLEAAGGTVVALGGVTPGRFRGIAALGFRGAAMLGYVWDNIDEFLT